VHLLNAPAGVEGVPRYTPSVQHDYQARPIRRAFSPAASICFSAHKHITGGGTELTIRSQDGGRDTRTFFRGERLLNNNAEALFALPSTRRRVRIMVTLSIEAAYDFELVRDLLRRGMNCVRINCAHDTPAEREAMVAHVRRAEQESERMCKVLMDLGGPKARTGQVVLPGPKQRLHIGEHITCF
jgi:hypothetical protein